MIIVRCDASPKWGMGHLTRCRALARALQRIGIPVSMVGPERTYAEDGDEVLFQHWQPMGWHDDHAFGAQQVLSLAKKWHAQGLILDEPRAGDTYQRVLFEAQFPWLQFDGTAGKPLWATWILNALPSAHASDYATVLRNPEATLLMGPEYAVLRPEFESVYVGVKSKQPINILVSFGGGDDRGAMAWCINALLPLLGKHTHLKIISGQVNPRNASNLAQIPPTHRSWIDYAIQPDAPWSIMSKCHMAVMASGTTTQEANCCKLPMVLVSLVDNQHAPGQAWANALQGQYLGPWEQVEGETLFKTVVQFIDDLLAEKRNSPTLVDGQGATRVAKALQRIYANPNSFGFNNA